MKSYPNYKDSGIEWMGQIPSHWRSFHLKNCVTIYNGKDYKDIESNEGYPVFGSGGVFTFATDKIYDGEVLLMGRKGTIDKPLYYKGPFWVVDTMFYAIPHSNSHGKFLYYCATQFPFKKISTATALPSMTQTDLYQLPIMLPPLDEQQRIADYLDEKCGEIDGQVSLLEKERGAYIRLKESIINKSVTQGLDPDVPTRDSGIDGIGVIPDHWSVKRIKDLGILGSGTTPKSGNDAYYDDGTHPWLNTGCVQNCIINEPAKYITELAMKECSGLRYYPKDTILIAMYGGGTIGNVGLMGFDATINQACCAIELSNQHKPKFLFYAIMAQNAKLISNGFGGTQINLSQGQIANFLLAVPPLEEQQRIANYLDDKCSKIDSSVENISQQIDAYKRLKKSLINEVVTGKRAV